MLKEPLDLLVGRKTVRVEYMVTPELNREINRLAAQMADSDLDELAVLEAEAEKARAAKDQAGVNRYEMRIAALTAGHRAEAARVLTAEGAYAIDRRRAA